MDKLPREWLLREAIAVITRSRTQQYAPPDEDFDNIARLWTVILGPILQKGHSVSKTQVALCMDAVKTARLINNPGHVDSWVDKGGYAGCGFEVSPAVYDPPPVETEPAPAPAPGEIRIFDKHGNMKESL